MLMSVDEVGSAAERIDEGPDLAADLGRQRVPVEAVRDGMAGGGCERQERTRAQRLEALAQRSKGRREREMQPDRDARRVRVEHVKRDRFRAVKARRRHQHRRGVEARAHHEIADRDVDRARNAEIVGAQPDATGPAG